MDLIVSSRNRAVYGNRTYRCAIGRGGISSSKTEGDGASPAGQFELLRVLYRADRVAAPETDLDTAALADSDGWCDDPADARYNRPVTLPYPAGCETMCRDDGLYDIVVVTDHNSDPVVRGAGSAIFVHVAGGRDYPPTEGCIAFAEEDLREILAAWQPGTDRIVITAEP